MVGHKPVRMTILVPHTCLLMVQGCMYNRSSILWVFETDSKHQVMIPGRKVYLAVVLCSRAPMFPTKARYVKYTLFTGEYNICWRARLSALDTIVYSILSTYPRTRHVILKLPILKTVHLLGQLVQPCPFFTTRCVVSQRCLQ